MHFSRNRHAVGMDPCGGRGQCLRSRALSLKLTTFLNNLSRRTKMKGLLTTCAIALPLMLCLPGLAAADPKCKIEHLSGRYVFTATGFTRPPSSAPGTPWVPKAIVEVLQFNGDGTLTTPGLAIANPFNDLGNIL